MAEHPRTPPAHPLDQQHGADHQGHADGRRVEDAQGAAGRDRHPAVRRACSTASSGRRRRTRSISRIRCWKCARSRSARSSSSRADKGLCGALNSNVFRLAAQFRSAVDRLHHGRPQGRAVRRPHAAAARRPSSRTATRRVRRSPRDRGARPRSVPEGRGGRGPDRGDAIRQHADPAGRSSSSFCRSAKSRAADSRRRIRSGPGRRHHRVRSSSRAPKRSSAICSGTTSTSSSTTCC